MRALEQHRFNRTAAGASLGLSLRQMRYRMARLGVNVGGDGIDGSAGPRAERRRARVARSRLARRLVRGARRIASPNFGPRPAGAEVDLVVSIRSACRPGEYGGDAIERLFTNRLDWRAHPYFETIARPRRCRRISSIRRDGELLQFVSLRRARLACRRVAAGRAAPTATTSRSASSSKGSKASAFEPAQYDALAGCCAALRAALSDRAVAGHEHVAPGRKNDPGAGLRLAAAARRLGWPATASLRGLRRREGRFRGRVAHSRERSS